MKLSLLLGLCSRDPSFPLLSIHLSHLLSIQIEAFVYFPGVPTYECLKISWDEMQKEDDGNSTQNFLLCRFYKYIINGDLKINNKTEFLLLQSDVSTHINNERMAEEKQKVIMLIGRWSAASYKGGDEVDSSLALILNEWMQFKVLK